jgi:cytochrome c oxidase subunit 1
MSSVGSSVLAVGYALPLFYLLWSLRYGKYADANPWGSTGLEWTVPSPPPEHNFETAPIVDSPPYCYPLRQGLPKRKDVETIRKTEGADG